MFSQIALRLEFSPSMKDLAADVISKITSKGHALYNGVPLED